MKSPSLYSVEGKTNTIQFQGILSGEVIIPGSYRMAGFRLPLIRVGGTAFISVGSVRMRCAWPNRCTWGIHGIPWVTLYCYSLGWEVRMHTDEA